MNNKTHMIMNKKTDAFLSFAFEERNSVAMPLATLLKEKSISIWFSSHEFSTGIKNIFFDINEGIINSRYGIAIISPTYLLKKWTKTELAALFAKEDHTQRILLPIWHQISYKQILKHIPLLADRFSLHTDMGMTTLANRIERIIKMNALPQTPNFPRTFGHNQGMANWMDPMGFA